MTFSTEQNLTVPAAERLDLVDALRGFALFGLFVIHCVELFELYWLDPQPGWVHTLVFGLFAGKSFALFALLFGLSFFLIMDRARARGTDYTARFVWRLALLLVIGLAHGLIYRGEILQVLAPLGLSLLLFERVRSNALLVGVAALMMLQPFLIYRVFAAAGGAEWALSQPGFWTDPGLAVLGSGNLAEAVAANWPDGNRVKWDYYIDTGRVWQVGGLFILGLVLGRLGVFREPGRFVMARRLVLLAGGLVMLAAWRGGPALAALVPDGEVQAMTRVWLDTLISGYGNLGFLAVQVVLFIELYETAARPCLRWLAAPGRMTLTLYVGQSLVFVPVFYGFGLGWHETISQPQALLLGLVGFAAQAVFAAWWFGRFRYGPLEWGWRAATWMRLDVPLRKGADGV